MMYTAIYLSFKVEEVNFSLFEFSKVSKGCSIEKIVQYETFLIKGLKFQFFVYSPFRWLEGYYKILKNNIQSISIQDFDERLEEIYELAKKGLRQLYFTDLNFLYSPSIIAFGALSYAFTANFTHDIFNNEDITNLLKTHKVFDDSFWDFGVKSEDETRIEKVRLNLITNYGKEPSISSIKIYKKLIKGVHLQLPNYLSDMNKRRKEKEVIPVEFLSDDETKEEESDQFKPPKPMRPGKRSLSINKFSENQGEHICMTFSSRRIK